MDALEVRNQSAVSSNERVRACSLWVMDSNLQSLHPLKRDDTADGCQKITWSLDSMTPSLNFSLQMNKHYRVIESCWYCSTACDGFFLQTTDCLRLCFSHTLLSEPGNVSYKESQISKLTEGASLGRTLLHSYISNSNRETWALSLTYLIIALVNMYYNGKVMINLTF